MAITYEGSTRIGVRQYWTIFAGSLVVSVIAIIVAVFTFLSASYFLFMMSVLAMFASGIYLRIAEMRRCRDIGWPAALPWVFFGILVLLAMVSFQGGLVSLASSGFSIMVSLADLGFAILVGCIPGKVWQPPSPSEYQEFLSPGAMSDIPDDEADRSAHFDDAVARALQSYQAGAAQSQHPAHAAPVPARPVARVTGFGRKGMA